MLAKVKNASGRIGIFVVRYGHVSIARQLIGANCQLNLGARSRQAGNQTALHFAVRHGHEQIVRLLLEAGCDVNLVCIKLY